MRETELAKYIVNWLTNQRFDVYQEVQLGGSVADIVAILGNLCWIVECKTSLSASVAAQAHHWIPWAHIRSIAVPRPRKRPKVREYLERCLDRDGTGVIEVSRVGNVYEAIKPAVSRRPQNLERLRATLRPEHKHLAAAGTNRGGYWTPFKQTVGLVEKFLRTHPGASMKQVVEGCTHHYASAASARACLARYVLHGIIDTIEGRLEAGKLHYYLKEDKPLIKCRIVRRVKK